MHDRLGRPGIEELRILRSRVAHLERANAEHQRTPETLQASEEYKLLLVAEQVAHVGSYSRDLRTGAARWSD